MIDAYSLSACLIVRNEEKFLPTALSSIHEIASEIIIVDTGSTDRSIEIGRNYGAKVFSQPWENDFSKARNQAIKRANGTHILMLDADEQLEPGSAKLLLDFIKNHPLALGQVHIRSHYASTNGQVFNVITHVTRVIPRHPSITYKGKIHEQIVFRAHEFPHILTDVYLSHRGYALSPEMMLHKTMRNINILQDVLMENTNNPYLQFQLGKSLAAIQKDQEAWFHYEISLHQSKPTDGYFPDLLLAALHLAKKMRMENQLWQLVRLGITVYPDYPDLYFFIGKALMELGVPNLSFIQQCFEICLKLGDRSQQYPGVEGTGTYLAHFNLGAFFESQQLFDQAIYHYELASQMGYMAANTALQRIGIISSASTNLGKY